jgi:hypothetical protein
MTKTLRNVSTLMLATVLLVQSGAQAQTVAGQPEIKARVRGRFQLVLKAHGKAHAFDVTESVDAAKLDDATILFETRRQDFTYLLISACGPSKLKPDDHECGAGRECNLLWLKLSAAWKLDDIKSTRYESCWAPISSDEGYKITGRVLRLDYYDLRKKVNYHLTYDADRPESGWSVEEMAIKGEESK